MYKSVFSIISLVLLCTVGQKFQMKRACTCLQTVLADWFTCKLQSGTVLLFQPAFSTTSLLIFLFFFALLCLLAYQMLESSDCARHLEKTQMKTRRLAGGNWRSDWLPQPPIIILLLRVHKNPDVLCPAPPCHRLIWPLMGRVTQVSRLYFFICLRWSSSTRANH